MKKTQFQLRQLIGTQTAVWVLAWFLGLLTVWSVLGLTILSGWFVTMSAAAGLVAVGGHTFNYMMPAGIIRGFAIVRTLSRYGDLMVSHHAVFGLLKDLRVRFFQRWASLSFATRSAQAGSSSQRMHRLVKDIDVLNEFILRFVTPWVMAVGAVLAVGAVMITVLPSAWLSVLLLIAAMAVAVVVIYLAKAFAIQESTLHEQHKSQLLDTLPALTSLLIWGQWRKQTAQLTHIENQRHALTLSTHGLRRISAFVIQILHAVALLLLLWAMGEFFAAADIVPFTEHLLNDYPMMSSAVALALFLGLVGLGEFLQNLVAEPLAYGRSLVAKDRLNAMIADEDNIAKSVHIDEYDINHLSLKIENATVKAPKAIIGASHLNAVITHDKPCLIVGASGAGKSTLLHTIAQEHQLVAGQMCLADAVQSAELQTVDFGASMGFLGQAVDIFDQTLADNLRLGKPTASDDELYAVLNAVGLGDWVRAQPQGLATPLGEYGMAVSGGQARRIALARLLLAPKSLLLLDEPFAGLDSDTRKIVWQYLADEQRAGRIGLLIISTHQLWDEMGAVDVLKVGE
ncbi:ATP-binding cassette domain-containing protein [Moraxella sp. FZLJ2107]|uniref:amino acid ABC transporter ATP-binding/permease protein n=1 Tax=unclassified Moraxella TaxID=2685852 RepID=UPI0020C930EC|nr:MULTISPECIES: ATP-binding cassette domain-containing protein [unclassified Moraxella]UTO05258.1 ATP-binding cassette domain-containing protein [Moraxella sp. FZLJ2107]UTO21993.1 ATP-binding cassette domain-containing protein [Moraxella sp. FZLJ2109]